MDILSGQVSVTRGTVFVDGKRVLPSDISQVVSMCGQVDTIWPDITVLKAITIFMLCRGYRGNLHFTQQVYDPYISHLINKLGLEEMLKKKVKTLSGGQRRRLSFLVSLMGNTKVVLVDEAMTGVDVETRQIMWNILQDEVRLRNRSVVVTSHDMSEVEQYCNTVGILHNGTLIEMGRLEEIKKKWGDSIKLICLLSSQSSVSIVESIIKKNLQGVIVESPHIDVLDELEQTRIVATYKINLIDLKNIAGLVRTMDGKMNKDSVLYWSIEPQSLDDFVRSQSNSGDASSNTNF
jgi:ATP-binding cassette subfamily A (ABC1) protein 5